MDYDLTYREHVRRTRVRTILVVATAFIAGGFILPNLHISWGEPQSQAQLGVGLGIHPSEPQKTLSPEEIYAHAAQIAYKSVVNIDTTQRVEVHDFFGSFFSEGPKYQQQQSEGSGVIIDPNGYILTNEHVVGPANEANKEIYVSLTDGRRLRGRVIGADHITDVALVKVAGSNLPTAKVGTAVGLVPGQMAVALGNPFHFRFTVTHGVISALRRPVTTPDGRIYPDLIQHDALINPGNSGGALVNIQGQVIGINTLVYSQAQGIGFAIPIDTALKVADELKRFGKIKRPWLGVSPLTNSTDLAEANDLPDAAGVVIQDLWRNSPAVRAGLRRGDIITRLNGKPVHNVEEFKEFESSCKIGQQVKVEVLRSSNGQITRGQGDITVGEAP